MESHLRGSMMPLLLSMEEEISSEEESEDSEDGVAIDSQFPDCIGVGCY